MIANDSVTEQSGGVAQARHAAAEAVRGVAALSAALADCTLAGLALMSVSLLYCGLRRALLSGFLRPAQLHVTNLHGSLHDGSTDSLGRLVGCRGGVFIE